MWARGLVTKQNLAAWVVYSIVFKLTFAGLHSVGPGVLEVIGISTLLKPCTTIVTTA